MTGAYASLFTNLSESAIQFPFFVTNGHLDVDVVNHVCTSLFDVFNLAHFPNRLPLASTWVIYRQMNQPRSRSISSTATYFRSSFTVFTHLSRLEQCRHRCNGSQHSRPINLTSTGVTSTIWFAEIFSGICSALMIIRGFL